MKQILGVLLIIVGVAYFSFRGFHYPSRQPIVIGPFATSRVVEKPVLPYSPILTGAIIAGGAILLITGTLQRSISR